MDVLFLSVAAGGGHIKACEALKEHIENKFPGSRCLVVDTLKYVNPIIDTLVIRGLYLNAVKNAPRIWGKIYDLTESRDNVHELSKSVNKLLAFKIKKLIDEFKPSIIVSTHTFPLQMLSSLKKKGKITIPTMAIITDFVPHPFWLYENIDAYVVAHEFMHYDMVKRGIPKEIIYPYGIPVSSSFQKSGDKAAILKELGLEDKLTILLMDGSLGFGRVGNTFASLLGMKKDLQIIAVTGHNIRLKRNLERLSKNSEKKVRIFSYTDRIADLMEVSDFIITKPGGLTISESLVKELPILINSPIPGQEVRNANFLQNSGAAVRIMDDDSLDGVLHQILDNPLTLNHMKEMAKRIARPNAAEDTIALMESLVNSHERLDSSQTV